MKFTTYKFSLSKSFTMMRVTLYFSETVDFYSAPQCSHFKRCTSYGNSARLSVCLSVTRRCCVKTMAHSTVQFALSDSKMCLVL